MSLETLITQLSNKEVTPLQLVQEAITKIESQDHLINAVVHRRFDKARMEAHRDYSKTVFKGIPILIKNLSQDLKGEPSTAGSKLLKDNISKETNHFVRKIQELGFIIIGQTNTPEFGFKNITDSQLYGHTVHPFDHEKSPGGSSGGAAAALLMDYVEVVSASDGGGSIRIPASFCGLIGLKPTRGSMPVGPNGYRGWQGASVNFFLTKSLSDTKLLFNHMQTNTIEAPFNYVVADEIERQSLKIAYSVKSPVHSEVSDDAINAVKQTVENLRMLGHKVVEEIPPIDGSSLMDSYYLVNGVETAAMMKQIENNISRKLTIDDMELMTWVIYQYGLRVKGYQMVDALNAWDKYSAIMHEFHEQYDLYLTPTTAKTAPRIDTEYFDEAFKLEMMTIENHPNPLEIVWRMFEKSLAYTPFTMLANITGQPAISLPLYTNHSHEPLGVQFMAGKGQESLLFRISEQLLNIERNRQ